MCGISVFQWTLGDPWLQHPHQHSFPTNVGTKGSTTSSAFPQLQGVLNNSSLQIPTCNIKSSKTTMIYPIAKVPPCFRNGSTNDSMVMMSVGVVLHSKRILLPVASLDKSWVWWMIGYYWMIG